MRRVLLSLGFALVLSGLGLDWWVMREEAASGELVAAVNARRMTAAGPVQGGITADGGLGWFGVPYAAAPVGELRWRAPQSPAPWGEPRSALRHRAPCPQVAGALSPDSDADAGTVFGREDCLFLNVYAPAGSAAGAGLPVMVWLHGGGNAIGSGNLYDGGLLAREQQVVVVSINYRLGLLGWLSHAALRATATNELDASGNYALLDIVAALGWVQSNIAAFGGDPTRVTVFGESAGGRNTLGLLASPLAEGLFHRAIVQSGSVGTYSRSRAEKYPDQPEPGARFSSAELLAAWLRQAGRAENDSEVRRLAAALSSEDILVFLRSLSVEQVLDPVRRGGVIYEAPQLFRDGYVLPAEPLLDVFASASNWNRVPLLIGSNRDEMKLFQALDPRFTRRWFGLIPQRRVPDLYELLARYHSDAWKALGVDEVARRISAADSAPPVYAYRFDWDAGQSGLFVDLPSLLGAAHTLELDFLFGPLVSREVSGLAYKGNIAGRAALGLAMRGYWAQFARDAAPGQGGDASLPAWPAWRAEDPALMLLDAPADGGPRVVREALYISDIKNRLATDEEIPSGRFRCGLYVDLFLANGGAGDFFSPREYQALDCGGFPPWSLAGETR